MMLYKVLSVIDSSRFKSTVVSLMDRGTLGERIESLGIQVYTLGMKSGIPSPNTFITLRDIMSKESPDVIQGWMYHGNLMATCSALFSKKKCPVIWNVRQSLYSLKYEKRSTAAVIKAEACLSRFPRHIIYNSITGADQHENLGFNSKKRQIIPNGFDTEIFQPSVYAYSSLRIELNVPVDALIIGLVGRYHPMKDHATFLKAASILLQKHDAVHFVLIGKQVSNSNPELRQKLTDLNISQQIHLLGERSDTPQITAAFDIATCSSFTEGFPNVVGEAMSCGVPCVVTDVGDSALIVGDTGLVVPPRDPEALAAAWSKLLELGHDRRKVLGIRARQRIVDNFSLEVVVQQYERLYEECTPQGSSQL